MAHIFSFFAGAGFLDLGFERAGFRTVFVNEYHKPFLNAYTYARKNLHNPIDAPEFGVNEQSIEDLLDRSAKIHLQDLIKESRRITDLVGFIGGPPCPDFSIGGKNRGRDGENGRLSSSYVQLICQQKPDFFLFENVKGLWKTKRHREFYNELKRNLQAAGYVLTERIVNAIEYGVAQDRERIILLGFHRNVVPERVLVNMHVNQLRTDDEGLPLSPVFPWAKYTTYSLNNILNLRWPTTNPFQEESTLPRPNDIPCELTVEGWFEQNDVNNHPNAEHWFKPRAALPRFLAIPEGDDSKKSFKRLHRWRYSPTAAYGNNEVHLHPYKARRLTVAEALAIQSLPKDFTLPPDMSLSNMFKTVGNGVPFVAANGIARSIRFFLGV
jgi:DNA (cytosine-5)-methyltransferase 1